MKKVWLVILLVAFTAPILGLAPGFGPMPAYAGDGQGENDNAHGDNDNQ